jgi:CRP-like cAMP-binding protein
MNDITLLQSVSLFSRLDNKHLKAILRACTERVFEPEEFLVEQGHPGIGLFIIVEGRVSIVKTLRNGAEVHIAENGPGDVIGEMSVIDGALRTASVRAIDRTVCLVLSAWSFKSLMEHHPEVALGVLPIIMQRFRDTNNALLEISSRNNDHHN